jgi:hypothetical protein
MRMGIFRCRVSYLDQGCLDHAVEVDAESLYEAVALASRNSGKAKLSRTRPAR